MQFRWFHSALVLLTLPAAAHASPPAPVTPDCADILPGIEAVPSHPLTAEDLIRLRDIGPPDGGVGGPSPISTSPDGKLVAFQIRRADPAINSYCLAMVVMTLRRNGLPRIVDQGGTLIRYRYDDLWGMAGWQTGTPMVVTPRWSPDGRWIAFLKQVGDHVQVWRARVDGGGSQPVTRSADDIVDFAWAGDTAVIVSTRPDFRRQQQEIDREGRNGFLFDDRFQPLKGSEPMVRASAALSAFHVDVESGETRAATRAEAALVGATTSELGSEDLPATNANNRAWIGKRDPERYLSRTILSARLTDGRIASCIETACDRIVGVWWPRGQRDILFLGRVGWGASALGLYRWNPRAGGAPRKILETQDLLIGCDATAGHFLCLREGSSTPRHLVRIDLASGRSTTLFEPNPDFATAKLGRVERLQWRNNHGIECFGDLVVPPDHKPGQKHPTVIVQYQTRGFLRGGTGDEYPIFLLAARGYAVLSVQRPPELGGLVATRNQIEFERVNIAQWADRESVLSALLEGLALAEARGVVDPEHIGLTGLSDGVSTVQHALIETRIFKAAAISQCCDDPKTQTNYVGSQFFDFMEQVGYPKPGEDRPDFWRPHSIALNAANITTPILIQVSDDEFRSTLETFAALRRYQKPVEMFVYPGEHHIKWQPAHRLAVYERNLAWFDFWLRGITAGSAARQMEIARWQAMAREKSHAAQSNAAN